MCIYVYVCIYIRLYKYIYIGIYIYIMYRLDDYRCFPIIYLWTIGIFSTSGLLGDDTKQLAVDHHRVVPAWGCRKGLQNRPFLHRELFWKQEVVRPHLCPNARIALNTPNTRVKNHRNKMTSIGQVTQLFPPISPNFFGFISPTMMLEKVLIQKSSMPGART